MKKKVEWVKGGAGVGWRIKQRQKSRDREKKKKRKGEKKNFRFGRNMNRSHGPSQARKARELTLTAFVPWRTSRSPPGRGSSNARIARCRFRRRTWRGNDGSLAQKEHLRGGQDRRGKREAGASTKHSEESINNRVYVVE